MLDTWCCIRPGGAVIVTSPPTPWKNCRIASRPSASAPPMPCTSSTPSAANSCTTSSNRPLSAAYVYEAIVCRTDSRAATSHSSTDGDATQPARDRALRRPEPEQADGIGRAFDLDHHGQFEHELGWFESARIADETRTFFQLDDKNRVRRRERGIDGTVRHGPRVDAPAPARGLPAGFRRTAMRAAVAWWMAPGATRRAPLQTQ